MLGKYWFEPAKRFSLKIALKSVSRVRAIVVRPWGVFIH